MQQLMSILGIIVLYKQKLVDSKAFQSLSNAGFQDIFVYDNSPELPNFRNEKSHINIKYVHNTLNSGLSHAYNCAAKYAKENGYNWLLLSDQDTFFPPEFLEKISKAIQDNPDIKLFVPQIKVPNNKYMSPVPMNRYLTSLCDSSPNGIINPSNYGIINSGICVDLNAFFKVGGYNDEVTVDFADFQFIERFCTFFDKAYVVPVECQQSFSDIEQTIEQKYSRFKLFCQSLKHYIPLKKSDTKWLKLIVLKRCISLAISGKSLRPFQILYKYYL